MVVVMGEQMQINYSPWVLNRLPQYWDGPNDFRPERWIDGASANGGLPVPKNNALPFIPFNFGPRTCLGMKMVLLTCVVVVVVVVVVLMVIQWQAYLEIKIMAVLLLQKMDLVLAPDQVRSATLRCIYVNAKLLLIDVLPLMHHLHGHHQEVHYRSAITLSAKNGICMLPQPRP